MFEARSQHVQGKGFNDFFLLLNWVLYLGYIKPKSFYWESRKVTKLLSLVLKYIMEFDGIYLV